MPPAEFHAHFDDNEDMLLGTGVFDGIGLVIFQRKKKYATTKGMAFHPESWETCVQWVGQVWDNDIKI